MSDFDFDFAPKEYSPVRLNEEVLWPLVDDFSRRDWRERSVAGQQLMISEHDDKYEIRLHADCINAKTIDSPDDSPIIKVRMAGLNVIKLIDNETMLQDRLESANNTISSVILHDHTELQLHNIWVVNFSDAILPSVASLDSISIKSSLEQVWEGDDIYTKPGDENEEQCGEFGDFEMDQIAIGLRVLKASSEIFARFKDIRDNPIK